MVKTASTMLPLGTKAPDFSLPDADGKTVSLADFADAPALLVIFMCNHCPYVKHVAAGLAELARDYQARGVAVVGINSNDVDSYPDDSPAQDGRGSRSSAATRSPICTTRRRRWPRRIARPARPTSTCSTRTASWSIAARWIPAGPAATFPSPARTSARRSTPCWPASRSRPTRSPASAATSSGSRATSRILRLSQRSVTASTNSGTTSLRDHAGRVARGPAARRRPARPRGPKSSVQSLTYIPTNRSACVAVQAAAEAQGVVRAPPRDAPGRSWMLCAQQPVDVADRLRPEVLADGVGAQRQRQARSASNHHWPSVDDQLQPLVGVGELALRG